MLSSKLASVFLVMWYSHNSTINGEKLPKCLLTFTTLHYVTIVTLSNFTSRIDGICDVNWYIVLALLCHSHFAGFNHCLLFVIFYFRCQNAMLVSHVEWTFYAGCQLSVYCAYVCKWVQCSAYCATNINTSITIIYISIFNVMDRYWIKIRTYITVNVTNIAYLGHSWFIYKTVTLFKWILP